MRIPYSVFIILLFIGGIGTACTGKTALPDAKLITPPPGKAVILVKAPIWCNYFFHLRGDQIIDENRMDRDTMNIEANKPTSVPPGTYSLLTQYIVDFEDRSPDYEAIKQDFVVEADKLYEIDLTNTFGALVVLDLLENPGSDPMANIIEGGRYNYKVKTEDQEFLSWDEFSTNYGYCLPPGKYTITMLNNMDTGGHILGPRTIPTGVFPLDALKTVVEIKVGEETFAGKELRREVGKIAFKPNGTYVAPLNMTIYDRTNNFTYEFDQLYPIHPTTLYSILVGTYDIVLGEPFGGVKFTNIKIKAGKLLELSLPKASD